MTTTNSKDRKEQAVAYLNQSLRYLENASKTFGTGNPEKTGEFLWGSVATAFKALVMAKKGEKITSHAQFWDIARELTRETGDISIYDSFREANSLHSNFYESRLSLDDIKMSSPQIIELTKRLKSLTEESLTITS